MPKRRNSVSPSKSPPKPDLSRSFKSTPKKLKNGSPKKSPPKTDLSQSKSTPKRMNSVSLKKSPPKTDLSQSKSTPKRIKSVSLKKSPPKADLSRSFELTPQKLKNVSPKKSHPKADLSRSLRSTPKQRKSVSPKETPPKAGIKLTLRRTPSVNGVGTPDETAKFEVVPTPEPGKRVTRTNSRYKKSAADPDSPGSPYEFYKSVGRVGTSRPHEVDKEIVTAESIDSDSSADVKHTPRRSERARSENRRYMEPVSKSHDKKTVRGGGTLKSSKKSAVDPDSPGSPYEFYKSGGRRSTSRPREADKEIVTAEGIDNKSSVNVSHTPRKSERARSENRRYKQSVSKSPHKKNVRGGKTPTSLVKQKRRSPSTTSESASSRPRRHKSPQKQNEQSASANPGITTSKISPSISANRSLRSSAVKRKQSTSMVNTAPEPSKVLDPYLFEDDDCPTPKRSVLARKLVLKPDTVESPFKTPIPETPKVAAAKTPMSTPKPKVIFGKKSVKCPVPCREEEFQRIWGFMKSNLEASESGCIYVSGVPGTGKTLVVKAVLKALDEVALESKPPNFKHVYINGLSLGAPQKIWNRLYQSIIGKKMSISSDKALANLEKYFSGKHVPVILIVDELDQLLDRQQSIVYRLLEWSSNNSALFSFVAIFNTINLPEKALDMKNISRLGLDRVVFSSYNADQVKGILQHYLGLEKSRRLGEAMQLISRKVAAVSGDARRALEIARRALEIMDLKKISGVHAVNETFKELFSAPKIQAIECCSTLEQKILTTIANDCQSSGKEETTLNKVVSRIRSTCLVEGMPWSIGQILSASGRLFASKLILLENQDPTMYKRVQLNVPIEDINFVFKINDDIQSD